MHPAPVPLLVAFLALTSVLPAQRIVRGPYLQLGTPDSVVVRWRTDVPTESVVRVGADPARLDRAIQPKGKTTEHIVHVGGLQPATRYHYAVGHPGGVLPEGAGTIVTSPPPGTRRPIRTWVVGDAGTAGSKGYEGQQAAVRDAYLRFTGERHTDVFLQLGDNAYNTGTDAEHQVAVFDVYRDILRRTVTWPTLGNHDAGSATSVTQSGVYFDLFTLPTRAQAGGLMSGTEAYYSFDYGNIHFVCLDSHDSDRSPDGAMLTWLRHDLAATKQDWIIAYFHHPPYTKGSHDSNVERQLVEMRENALPILEAGGVDLCLTGHSHSYERSFLIDRHYGKQDTFKAAMKVNAGDGRPDGTGPYRKATLGRGVHEGAVYIVAGSSGKITGKTEKTEARGFLDHPAMFLSLYRLGSLVLDVDGNRLDAAFLTEKGERLDHFTILKGK